MLKINLFFHTIHKCTWVDYVGGKTRGIGIDRGIGVGTVGKCNACWIGRKLGRKWHIGAQVADFEIGFGAPPCLKKKWANVKVWARHEQTKIPKIFLELNIPWRNSQIEPSREIPRCWLQHK